MFNRVTSRRSRAQARRAAEILNDHPAQVVNAEMRILINTVEDLVARLAKSADPELTRLRRQTEAALAGAKDALASAKDALADGGAQLRDQASELAERGDAYVRERPWTSLSLVALGVLAIGLWTGRALTSEWTR